MDPQDRVSSEIPIPQTQILMTPISAGQNQIYLVKLEHGWHCVAVISLYCISLSIQVPGQQEMDFMPQFTITRRMSCYVHSREQIMSDLSMYLAVEVHPVERAKAPRLQSNRTYDTFEIIVGYTLHNWNGSGGEPRQTNRHYHMDNVSFILCGFESDLKWDWFWQSVYPHMAYTGDMIPGNKRDHWGLVIKSLVWEAARFN